MRDLIETHVSHTHIRHKLKGVDLIFFDQYFMDENLIGFCERNYWVLGINFETFTLR